MVQRYRPGAEAEQYARDVVRARFADATSAYSETGAVVVHEATGEVLGRASAGDWAVELAWQDAMRRQT